MSTPLTVTYATLQREVGRFLGYGRDPTTWSADAVTDVADILQSGVRRVLTPPPIPGEKYAHEWSFLRPTTSFTTTIPVGSTVDGSTIIVVSGVVTLAGSGCTVNIVTSGGAIISAAVNAGGSGYAANFSFTLSVVGGTGGTITATTNSLGVVTSVKVFAPGTGYSNTTGAATPASAFPTWAAQGSISVPTGTFIVQSRDSGTQLTLVDPSVNVSAGSSYTLGQTVYSMPADFADIDGPLVYATGQTILRNRVDRTSEYQVLMDMAYEVTPSYPRTYALRVQKNPTPPPTLSMTATTGYEIILSPTPDANYALFFKYRVAIPALDSMLTTPPGGDAHGELYLESCLAASEQKLQDTAGLHTARFLECLAASVSHDRKLNQSDTLGFNRDTSDRMSYDLDDHYFTQPNVTSITTGGTRYP